MAAMEAVVTFGFVLVAVLATAVGRVKTFDQGRTPGMREAAELLAHGLARADEGASGGVDIVTAGAEGQLPAKKVLVSLAARRNG